MASENQTFNNQGINPKDATDCKIYYSYTILSKFATFRLLNDCGMQKIIREITPLTQADCFTIFSRIKSEFDFPLHSHEELELNFIMNAKGARRIVGDHIGDIDDLELVLVGSNLPHVW